MNHGKQEQARMDHKVRWSHPSEWLLDHIDDIGEEFLRNLARELASLLDGDQIQDTFQEEMDNDGYFEEEEEGSTP